MRHKYATAALVLARSPLGESHSSMMLLTRDLGLVRARAQSLRRSGARLATALTTLTQSDVVLVRGAEGWRVTGAVASEYWFASLPRTARLRAVRVVGLLLRLAPPESADPVLFALLTESLAAFIHEPEPLYDAIECRTVLALLGALGLGEGSVPALAEVAHNRMPFVARANRGISLSGL